MTQKITDFVFRLKKWRSHRIAESQRGRAESKKGAYLIAALEAFLALIFPHSVGHIIVLQFRKVTPVLA